jgi:ribosomal protein L24E
MSERDNEMMYICNAKCMYEEKNYEMIPCPWTVNSKDFVKKKKY